MDIVLLKVLSSKGGSQQDPHGGPASASRAVAPPKTLVNKIFVGRLAEKITEDTLREFFDKEAKQLIDAAAVSKGPELVGGEKF